ncbi:hypothetical protein EYD10_03416 [Varanus komodoensis]|nr:hypothetical protein EYD10_03416 [Varanus komodoensis]
MALSSWDSWFSFGSHRPMSSWQTWQTFVTSFSFGSNWTRQASQTWRPHLPWKTWLSWETLPGNPIAPEGPMSPGNPGWPGSPGGPPMPGGPMCPFSPFGPSGPGRPGMPRSPLGPWKPGFPIPDQKDLESQELLPALEVLALLEALACLQVPVDQENQSFLACLSREVQQDLEAQANQVDLLILAVLESQCLCRLLDPGGLAFQVVLSFLAHPLVLAVLAILCHLVSLFQVVHEVLVVLGVLECPLGQFLPSAPSLLLVQEPPFLQVFLAFRACLACQSLDILVDLVFLWLLALQVLVTLEIQVGLLVQAPQEDPAHLSNWLMEFLLVKR